MGPVETKRESTEYKFHFLTEGWLLDIAETNWKLLSENEMDFHPACSKKIFGQPTPAELPYEENQVGELALQVVQSQISVTGVQDKLWLHLITGEKKAEPNVLPLLVFGADISSSLRQLNILKCRKWKV